MLQAADAGTPVGPPSMGRFVSNALQAGVLILSYQGLLLALVSVLCGHLWGDDLHLAEQYERGTPLVLAEVRDLGLGVFFVSCLAYCAVLAAQWVFNWQPAEAPEEKELVVSGEGGRVTRSRRVLSACSSLVGTIRAIGAAFVVVGATLCVASRSVFPSQRHLLLLEFVGAGGAGSFVVAQLLRSKLTSLARCLSSYERHGAS